MRCDESDEAEDGDKSELHDDENSGLGVTLGSLRKYCSLLSFVGLLLLLLFVLVDDNLNSKD